MAPGLQSSLSRILVILAAFQVAQAAEGEPVTPEPATEATPPPVVHAAKRSGNRGVREKEAEGTQAPDRFETDSVIKSKYHLNGQPLEVDPD